MANERKVEFAVSSNFNKVCSLLSCFLWYSESVYKVHECTKILRDKRDMEEEKKIEWVSGEDALAMMGITIDEVDEKDQDLIARRAYGNDRQICLCGHGVSRHTVVSGVVFCKPARMECPCKRVRPVLVTEDTRMFIRKTEGSGSAHALTRGIRAAVEKNKGVSWVVDLMCDRCGKSDNNVVPVAVTQSGHASSYATGYDALLCPDCRLEV